MGNGASAGLAAATAAATPSDLKAAMASLDPASAKLAAALNDRTWPVPSNQRLSLLSQLRLPQNQHSFHPLLRQTWQEWALR